MKKGEHTHINGYHGRIILFAIMVGFCILALAAIVRGQRDIRSEQNRTALVNEPDMPLQEPVKTLKDSRDTVEKINSQDTESQDSEEVRDSGEAQDSEEVQDSENTQNSDGMQIVFLGDSILEGNAEFDNIDLLVAIECNAKVYNMAMGGTSASLVGDEQYNYEQWSSRCLLGVVNAIVGNIEKDIFDGFPAEKILEECNFEKTDYFVIEYGLNDFFSAVPESRYLADGGVREIDGAHTYAGALDGAVTTLQNAFPNAKILLINPHYCQFFGKDSYLGDAYTLDYGYGPLITYANVCRNVYEKHVAENVIFFDAFQNSGIKAETADWYLEDGVHLNASGRHLYAECISERILKDFYPVE